MCDDSKHDDNEVLKRRQFLKIGAASAAAAGLGVSSTTAHAATDPYAPPAKPGLPHQIWCSISNAQHWS